MISSCFFFLKKFVRNCFLSNKNDELFSKYVFTFKLNQPKNDLNANIFLIIENKASSFVSI